MARWRIVGVLAGLVVVLGWWAGVVNATVLSIARSPNASVYGGQLASVSCLGTPACTAVGTYLAGNGAMLAERWDGISWEVQSTANPPDAAQTVLSGVSCTSTSACTAVGNFSTNTGQVALAERWNGIHWAIQPTPNRANSGLLGVSCTSSTACTAVGFGGHNGNEMLAERWNGTGWEIQPTPNPTGASFSGAGAVSCASTTACTAVGFSFASGAGAYVSLAERWNGARWEIQPTPNPTEASFSYFLLGVSCASTTACTAVGNYTTSAGQVALAERWNGIRWEIQSTPNPPAAAQTVLSGVSCTSTTACTAVGNYTTSSGQVALAERWDGISWEVQPTPSPGNSGLFGVSCTSSTACTAVGSGPNGTLAERWNGTRWEIQPTP